MPRYFFHEVDSVVTRDDIGIELADVESARRAALAGIRALICEDVKLGRLNLEYRLEVEDEQGAPILTVCFGDAVEIGH